MLPFFVNIPELVNIGSRKALLIMKKVIVMNKGQKEAKIISPLGFSLLNLTSGRMSGVPASDKVPCIDMRLLNDTTAINCYSNVISGTTKLNGFDLLAAASTIPALTNQDFHTLECILPMEFVGEDTEVLLEFEVVMKTSLS